MRRFLLIGFIVFLTATAHAEDVTHDFNGSYALVIGIDHYAKPQWPALKPLAPG